ncbi:HTTM domain-containing protein [Pedobacter sp. 22226]|uniref:HTTM domain-containing protein n=1 Tax=Pedobacter sp. 22226 TaxID=3453894 RepID=UPI003F848C45
MTNTPKTLKWNLDALKVYLNREVSISPLITFRIAFGALMLFSTIRFWVNGWITSQYIAPKFFFTYMGFDWVKPLGDTGMHLVFLLIAVSAAGIILGLFYRLSAAAFFLSFTYVELIDVTNYLNHYYFVSIVGLLMIILPAGKCFSIDVWLDPKKQIAKVPFWTIGIIRLQLGMVYFFAGLAKLNYDWLIDAVPMKIWLPAKSHLPLVGSIMHYSWVAYLFSWFGAAYDLTIPFLLINRATRKLAFLAVMVFHACTAIFFPGIGMFPYVMMLSSLIFCSAAYHDQLLAKIFRLKPFEGDNKSYSKQRNWGFAIFLGFYFLLQVYLPLRFLLYPGTLFWTEEGYRFSWRVMLMEKSGNTFFYVKDAGNGKTWEVDNAQFLTPLQEKMMSTQPDMMLRYAHFLKNTYHKRGIKKPEVYAEGYVALNGRRSQSFIDSSVDLSEQQLSLQHMKWIKPFSNQTHK